MAFAEGQGARGEKTEIEQLREELANANKTIEHLTKAHKVLVERIDLTQQHNRDLRRIIAETARKERSM